MKMIKGVKVAATSSEISQLLFADDSLLCYEVKQDQVGVVMKILDEYRSASGQ